MSHDSRAAGGITAALMRPRTDVHRPSAIDPAEYDFVAFSYLKWEEVGTDFLASNRRHISDHMARTGGWYSQHEHGGSCDICGASCVYTAVFHHRPTNTYIRTGLECADKLDCGDFQLFRKKVSKAREAAAGKRKAQATLADAGLEHCWTIYTADRAEQKREESIVVDIVAKLVKYGSISEKATNYLRTLCRQIDERPAREAQRQAEVEAASPVPSDGKRHKISGKVLTVRSDENDAWGRTKMLVQADEGFRIWGTMPRGIDTDPKGKRIEFVASLQPSHDDPKFGFFSRPTNGRILECAP